MPAGRSPRVFGLPRYPTRIPRQPLRPSSRSTGGKPVELTCHLNRSSARGVSNRPATPRTRFAVANRSTKRLTAHPPTGARFESNPLSFRATGLNGRFRGGAAAQANTVGFRGPRGPTRTCSPPASVKSKPSSSIPQSSKPSPAALAGMACSLRDPGATRHTGSASIATAPGLRGWERRT